jgi:hypothetical protein
MAMKLRAANILVSLSTSVLVVCSTAEAANLNIDTIAGVYKHQFRNGNIAGDKYRSEDILEIVKVSPTAAYIRTHLEFFNAHVCDIWGVANVEGDALVFRNPKKNVQDKFCVLSVKVKNGKVILEDQDGACAIGSCGNRGMYNGTSFDLKRRRAIRYMDVLLKSDQYKDSIDEHDGKPRTRMPF